MVKLRLEFANLKQEDTENIAEFMGKVKVLAKELPDFGVDISIIVAQGILDLNYKEKLLFKYV